MAYSSFFDQNRLVAALKQMAVSRPFDIEVGRVSAVDMMHDLGKIAGRRFEQQVIMVVHQTKGVNDRLVSVGGGLKVFQKPFTVSLTLENGLALVATGGDVIKCARKGDSQRTRNFRPPCICLSWKDRCEHSRCR